MRKLLSVAFFALATLGGLCLFTACDDNGETEKSALKTDKQQIVYELNDSQIEYTVVGCNNNADDPFSIEIPNEFNGKPVVAIGDRAFYRKNLSSVTIAEGIREIGDMAFSECSELKSVSLPASLTTVTGTPFFLSNRIERVEIADLATWCALSWEEMANPVYTANCLYLNGDLLTELTIPEGVKKVESYSFEGCTSLTKISVAQSVTQIGQCAFYGCAAEQLTILGECEIGTFAFGQDYEPKKIVAPASAIGKGGISLEKAESVTVTRGDLIAAMFGEPLKEVVLPQEQTSIGRGMFFGCKNLREVTIPDGVTEIEDFAFTDCVGLKSMQFPQGLRKIGYMAFMGCNGLTEIKLPDTVSNLGERAFSDCENLASVRLSNALTELPNDVFLGCSLLSAVELSENLKTIGEQAFYGCKNLQTLDFPSALRLIKDQAFADSGMKSLILGAKVELGWRCFDGCLIESLEAPVELLAQTVRYSLREVFVTSGSDIPVDAFRKCTGLEVVRLADSVQTIGDRAFYGCAKLKEVGLSSALKKIGDGAFFECRALQQIDLPASLTKIGESAFAYTGLTKIEIPETVTQIQDYTFLCCHYLTDVKLPSKITSIGVCAFDKCPLVDFVIPQSLAFLGEYALTMVKSVTIPQRFLGGLTGLFLKEITVTGGEKITAEDGLFRFTQLEKVTLADTFTEIGDKAFYRLYNLSQIHFSDSLKKIGDCAFYDCRSLKDVMLPQSLEEIGKEVFRYCFDIAEIVIPENVVKIGSDAFFGHGSDHSLVFADAANWYIVSSETGERAVGSEEISDGKKAAALFLRCPGDWIKR